MAKKPIYVCKCGSTRQRSGEGWRCSSTGHNEDDHGPRYEGPPQMKTSPEPQPRMRPPANDIGRSFSFGK